MDLLLAVAGIVSVAGVLVLGSNNKNKDNRIEFLEETCTEAQKQLESAQKRIQELMACNKTQNIIVQPKGVQSILEHRLFKDYELFRKYGAMMLLAYIPVKMSLNVWSRNLSCVTIRESVSDSTNFGNSGSSSNSFKTRTFYKALDLFLVESHNTARFINTGCAFTCGSVVAVGIGRFFKIF